GRRPRVDVHADDGGARHRGPQVGGHDPGPGAQVDGPPAAGEQTPGPPPQGRGQRPPPPPPLAGRPAARRARASVCSRGTYTPGSTITVRPQNRSVPVIQASGSPRSRRRVTASSAPGLGV